MLDCIYGLRDQREKKANEQIVFASTTFMARVVAGIDSTRY